MTLTPSPVPSRRSTPALLAALVTLVTMGLVVLSGVAADAAPRATLGLASGATLSQAAPGRTVAPKSRRDPVSLQAVAAALDADDLTEPRSRSAPPRPEPVAAARRPVRTAADLRRAEPLPPKRPPRA